MKPLVVHNQIGDSHLMNCNLCGAFFPKSGSQVIRVAKRAGPLSKVYASDILRTLYSLCHQKSQNSKENLKMSNSYSEVRTLIIDWLFEVCDNLKLAHRTLYHAINILDRFLSISIRQGRDMDQTLVMMQALSCLFISAKNYELDPHVPSSKKFLS